MKQLQLSPLKKLWHLILLEKAEVLSIYFYAILSGLIQLTVPLGVQSIIGFVMGASMVTSIYILIFLVVIGVLVVGIMQINQMKMIEKIQQKIFTRNAFAFAEKIPALNIYEMDKYYLPEKVNRFFDTLNVQKGLSKLLLDIPTASIQILFGLILLSLYHPAFILFGLILIGILWLILQFTSSKGLETSIDESNHKYSVVAWLQEMARAIKAFKYSQGTHFNLLQTDKNLLPYIASRTAHFKILIFQYKALVFFKVAITAAMLITGTFLLLTQKLNIGAFIAAEIVILTVINAVEKLIISLDSVYDVVTGLEKLSTITNSPSEQEGKSKLNLSNGIDIELNDVSFYYQNTLPILKNVQLQIPSFSLVAVSGKSGSGKSTLLKLLSANYQNFDGTILFNHTPIQHYTLQSLRNNTGVYLNPYDVFTGTVMENISLGKATVTTENIMEIAYDIGIHHFITALPNGFETIVDSGGKNLSGSLIKKILLLRALVNKPSLLLMEEPWQGLELEERDCIITYLKKMSKTATIIVATNDEVFQQFCTINIELFKGKVIIK